MMQGEDEKELERYRADEAAGLLLRLPAPLGATVWRVLGNPGYHHGVVEAELWLFGKVYTPRLIVKPVPFTLDLVDKWGSTVFLTETEGREAITHDTI